MCHFLGPVGKLWALAQVGAELVPARLAVILPCGPHLSSSECASCHWTRGWAPPLLPVVCWSVCHIATAADSVETLKGPRFSFSGVATRLRWPRLSFWRCTVMVPAEHTEGGEGGNQMEFTWWTCCKA